MILKILRRSLAVAALSGAVAAAAQPASLTAEQDHQAMMDQLRIKSLRPGFSGDETAPNHANYDPAKANPYPDYPDALRLENGRPVTTAEQWWTLRRPQIVEAFEREVVGRIPANVPKVTWHQVASEREFFVLPGGFRGVTATKLNGHVDNPAAPDIAVDIKAMLVLPEGAKNVPVLVMFGRANFPAPMPRRMRIWTGSTPRCRRNWWRAIGAGRDLCQPSGLSRDQCAGISSAAAGIAAAGSDRGWLGVLLLDTASIQADDGAQLRRGIIGLTNRGQARKPDDWGALRAWGWGRAGRSTIWRPGPRSISTMSGSRACHVTARRR
jgi:hypothetical protein